MNLRDAGDPVEIAAAYDKAGADELVFLDITASSDNRRTVVDMVRRVAETVFIPFTVGGGIRTVEDFRMLLREGGGQDFRQFRRNRQSAPDLGGRGQIRQAVRGGGHRRQAAAGRQRLEHL